MADTGTGTAPTTNRCVDCGHPLDGDCGCSCTGPGCCYATEEARDGAAEARAGAMDPDALGDPDSRPVVRCRACNGLIHWDAGHYDTPHWVHAHIVDVVDCPEPGDIQPGEGEFFKAEQVF